MQIKFKWRHKKDTQSDFALVSTLLILIAAFSAYRAFAQIGVSLMLLLILLPPVARFLASLWMFFTQWIGFVNARMLLSLVWFIVLLPISLIYRIFVKDIRFGKKAPPDSNFFNKDKLYGKKDLENMW